MAQFRTANFNRILMKECEGKSHCNVNFPYASFARLPPAMQRLNMVLFAQVACTQTEEMLEAKNTWGLVAAVIGGFICLIFALSVQSMLKEQVKTANLIDLEIETVDDFSAQCLLDP